MQSTKLQIKKRVVYKHTVATLPNTKGKRNETTNDTTPPTFTATGVILW
jgi:hypothetical protein